MRTQQPVLLPSHDTLSRLARDNPQSFETLRLELIERCFDGATEPVRLRLRQLQFRIDGIRRRSGSPLGAAIKIHALMWESFLSMNDELTEFAVPSRRSPSRKMAGGSNARHGQSASIVQLRIPASEVPSAG
jgi:hypothetical protein